MCGVREGGGGKEGTPKATIVISTMILHTQKKIVRGKVTITLSTNHNF